ncbi:MAG: bacterioferritin [Candidatus Binatia bacterium]
MKPSAKLIETFNEILTAELIGINQYFAHAKLCRHWGYLKLAEINRKESMSEMKHADELMERIIYLGGIPNVQRLGKIRIGEGVPEQLKLDRELEKDAIARLNRAIEQAVSVHDNGSRALLEKILAAEEEHLDWLETQLTLIDQLGEAAYLAEQIHGA